MLRATLKSLLSRKLRLILSGLAVVLGVMFVAGAFVLTNTLGNAFDGLFSTVYSQTHVQVSGKTTIKGDGGGQDSMALLPASLVAQVKAADGVADAVGQVGVDGAHVIGPNGKVLSTSGAPRLGTNWTGEDALVHLAPGGHAPESDNQVVVNGYVAKQGNFKVGDQIGVITLGVKHTYQIVGIAEYSGGRNSIAGEQNVMFTTAEAQRVMLNQPGMFNAIDVKPKPGVSDTQLRDDVAAKIGPDYQVKTGAQLQKESSDAFTKALSFVNYILLGFAGVALFVGIFLILNTFSIIVAQRTKELALLRAIGGSRRQMINSVLVEAVVIGFLGSTIGLAAGIGIGALLAYVFTHIGGGELALHGIGIPPSAIIASYAVGIIVTVLAALIPAVRASRIPPVAAMRDAATPDKPLTKISLIGLAVFVVGAVALGFGLAGAGGATLGLILIGVLVSFIGVALLTPIISRPIVSGLGAIFTKWLPGMLGRRNSGRNPRRTAITAAALMVGIALITGINTVASSAKTSITALANTQVKADLIISGDQNSAGGAGNFDASVLTKTAAIPGVTEVSGLYADRAIVDGKTSFVGAMSEPKALRDMFSVTPSQGNIDQLGADQVVVDKPTADKDGLKVGDPVTIQFAKGDPATFTLSGIYNKSDLLSGWILPASAAANFTVPQPSEGFIMVAGNASIDTVKNQVSTLLADSPEVNVTDISSFVDQQSKGIDSVLTIIQILLALAIIIAILGVINTLALSVLERTREIGLLRAIGLRRGQTMAMVTVESVVISVFGAVLGLVVGVGLGAAVVQALHDQGINKLSLPWGQMVVYLVLAAIVGVVAAVLPAIRAARTNVLAAISYE